MTYQYQYGVTSSTLDKYSSIQSDVADAYSYLDEEIELDENELADELTDEQVNALLAEFGELA